MDTIGASRRNSVLSLPSASIVITTRNRRKEVLRAVESCLAQTGCTLEVLVFDDASEDGTADAVRSAAPGVRVFSSSQRKGLIHNRNRGFLEARGEVVVSLDDDAYFSSTDIVADTVACFREDASLGAVAIPYIEPLNVRSLSSLRSPFQGSAGDELRGYIGCAHAVRRQAALALGGYRELFIHQGEERDFCLRLWDAGWWVVYGRRGYIVHMVSPNRDTRRVSYYGARNRILFDWLNLPFPKVGGRLLWDPVAMLRYRFSWASLPVKLRGIGAGFWESLQRYRERRPVSRATYRRFASLPGHGPEEWSGEIPAPCVRSRTGPRTSNPPPASPPFGL